DQYAVLLRELSAIGNNINQIAYWANARKDISPRDIQDAKAYVTQAWRLVKEKL
ncbi:MAG: plasmid mobilization relaxosome protein MobC, partial [Oscillospiraceae bacterium]|nr:plasmid mobilization relaxosome protein MobC [Oscillospiraceae bacterium]